ncbi:MAG: hypothetical protein K8R18_13190 [Parvibaculum sp.]|nr:hypothetical protein [Parvibaculum sp.]
MIDLFAKFIGVVADFGAALIAFLWARDRERAAMLERTVEVQDAIRKAGELGPRDQSDAVERLRDGSF